MSFFRFTARTPVLMTSFVLMASAFAAMQWISLQMEDAKLLDFSLTPEHARSNLEALSDRTRSLHLWATSTIDVALPLSITFFLTGVISRFGDAKIATWLAYLPIIGGSFDLLENATIVMMLRGTEGLVEIKSLLTIAKFLFLLPAFGLAAVLVTRHVRKNQ